MTIVAYEMMLFARVLLFGQASWTITQFTQKILLSLELQSCSLDVRRILMEKIQNGVSQEKLTR